MKSVSLVLSLFLGLCCTGCSTTCRYSTDPNTIFTTTDIYSLIVGEVTYHQQDHLSVKFNILPKLEGFLGVDRHPSKSEYEIEQNNNKLKDFLQEQCTIVVRFTGDTTVLEKKFGYPRIDQGADGTAYYAFICEDLKEKASRYQSIQVTITINFGEKLLDGKRVDKRELILQRHCSTESFRLGH